MQIAVSGDFFAGLAAGILDARIETSKSEAYSYKNIIA
jgi:hypothetical protein